GATNVVAIVTEAPGFTLPSDCFAITDPGPPLEIATDTLTEYAVPLPLLVTLNCSGAVAPLVIVLSTESDVMAMSGFGPALAVLGSMHSVATTAMTLRRVHFAAPCCAAGIVRSSRLFFPEEAGPPLLR